MKNKKIIFIVFLLFFVSTEFCLAFLPHIVYTKEGSVKIENPEKLQLFYDELKEEPKIYIVNYENDFMLYLNILVPEFVNHKGRYSINVYKVNNDVEEKIDFIDGQTDFVWQEYYDNFTRDYYLKGPEFKKNLKAGNYKIEIFSYENKGKYVLLLGKNNNFAITDILNSIWVIPILKIEFLKTPIIQFFFTIPGLLLIGIFGFIFIFIAFILFLKSIIESIKKKKSKMMLLTSSGIIGSKEEILSLLVKPIENTRVAHIITASKPEQDKLYVESDTLIMKEMGLNVEEIDIEGKNYEKLLKLLSGFDIIYVQGGNTFYLLKQMRSCNFKKVIKKLMQKGVIYVGVSAGSIVMGKNIETAKWFGDENIVRMSDLNFSGLGFVPFDIFVHFSPRFIEVIKKKMPNPKKRKKLKILQDGQAIFVFGKNVSFVGKGEVINPQNL